jgi:class 3 adenylate cyclase/tetratricopeptide (TPR) repeat protein
MDVADWLRALGLERYEAAFRENDIGVEVLSGLTAEDLKDLGITSVGHRRQLLEAIVALRTNTARTRSPMSSLSDIDRSSESAAERRQLSVMFCDMAGFTALSARLDPEDLSAVIRSYQSCVATEIGRFGGFIARYVGDGVLIYFGWPEAREADAERTVRAALAVIAAIGQMAQVESLHVRIGIATGLVVVGELIGTGEARQQTAIGETPNLAARLQGLAEPDSVVIDVATRQQIGDLFDCRDLGLHSLKGLPEPVQAWQVLVESAVQSRFEALRAGTLMPLVGRDEELDLLLQRWQQAKSGDGKVVLVSGEPGIGKSRLTAALAERLAKEPHTRLRYFCSPHHQDSALYPFIMQLERAAGFERKDTTTQKAGKLQALFTTSDDKEMALVAELLSLRNASTELYLSPQRKRDKLFGVLLHQLESLARTRPVLMIFEDAHWIDPTSRELLDLTIDNVRRMPIQIVVTCRPEFRNTWGGHAHVTELTLSRLGGHDGATLVHILGGDDRLAHDTISEIVERADGVPLFVEELTRAVLETGDDDNQVAAVLSASPLPSLAIPTTLHASLIARLDRCGPTSKEIGQLGAVIGREFSYDIIKHAAELLEPELRQGLDRLAETGLLFCRGVPPSAHYFFKHSLLQDAAYGMLIRERRRLLHGRVAQAIEEHAPEIVEREPEVLAHHLSEAGRPMAATSYWLAAGRRAAQRSANSEAINHLRRGLKTSGDIEDPLEKGRLELALQLALGPALLATQGFTSHESGAAYRRAQALGEQLGEDRARFTATWGLWMFAATNGGGSPPKFEEIVHFIDILFFIAEQLDDQELRLQAYHAAWGTTVWMGDYSATCSHVRHGLALYDRSQHRGHAMMYGGHDPAVCGYAQSAIALWLQGYPEQARQNICEALDLAEGLGHAASTGHAFWLAATVYQLRGEFKEVLGCSERLLSIAREHGLLFYHGVGAMVHGAALAGLGELGTGIPEFRRNVEGFDNSKAKMMMGFYYSILAETELLAGYNTSAYQAFEKAKEHSNEFGNEFWRAGMLYTRGDLLAASDKYSEAEQSYQEALEVARRQGARSLELRSAMRLSKLWHGAGRKREARALLGPIYDWFTEGLDTVDLQQARVLLADFGRHSLPEGRQDRSRTPAAQD